MPILPPPSPFLPSPWPPSNLPSLEHAACILLHSRTRKSLCEAASHHSYLCSVGLASHPDIGNHLVPLFVDCGNVAIAHQIFRTIDSPNEFGWTSLVQGYADSDEPHLALALFRDMQDNATYPSAHTFVAVLKACAKLHYFELGQTTFSDITRQGLEGNVFVGSTLIDMYVECGSLLEAQDVFDKLLTRNIVSWNVLISGYSNDGSLSEVEKLVGQMRSANISPNAMTYVSFLKACSTAEAIEKGRIIHSEIVKAGYADNPYIEKALVDLYAMCGLLTEAYYLFSNISDHDVVSWTALISGYAEGGFADEALDCFQDMLIEGIVPDIISWNAVISAQIEQDRSANAFKLFSQMQEQGLLPSYVTYIIMLHACGSVAHLGMGKRMHCQLLRRGGILMDQSLSNALIDLYSRCGRMRDAQEVFDRAFKRDLVTWNSIITGYARAGESDWVFNLFHSMRVHGVKPDEVTFLSVLNACSHVGLMDMAKGYLGTMMIEYGLIPSVAHHNCIVDLLVRAGNLNEAVEWLRKIPCQPDLLSWSTILRASQNWGNLELGKDAFNEAMKLDGKHDAAFTIMSNIYADA